MDRVRALTDEMAAAMSPGCSNGFYKPSPPALSGFGDVKLINNTKGCTGPTLAIFRGEPPEHVWWDAMPDDWIDNGATMLFAIAKGTLVPDATIVRRHRKPTAKRQRSVLYATLPSPPPSSSSPSPPPLSSSTPPPPPPPPSRVASAYATAATQLTMLIDDPGYALGEDDRRQLQLDRASLQHKSLRALRKGEGRPCSLSSESRESRALSRSSLSRSKMWPDHMGVSLPRDPLRRAPAKTSLSDGGRRGRGDCGSDGGSVGGSEAASTGSDTALTNPHGRVHSLRKAFARLFKPRPSLSTMPRAAQKTWAHSGKVGESSATRGTTLQSHSTDQPTAPIHSSN